MVAPFDSLVASRNDANFSSIDAGHPVARLDNISEIQIEIDAPEILLQQAGWDPDIAISAEFLFAEERFALKVR